MIPHDNGNDGLEAFRQAYRDRRTKQQNGNAPIIGHCDTNFPEEIALAAGCRTVLLTGDPAADLRTILDRVDTASSAPFRYLLEAILRGSYDFVDLICTTGGDRWLSILDGVLREEKRNDPTLPFGDSYFVERLRTTYFRHRAYNLERMRDFAAFVEARYACKIEEQRLRDAIALMNETRRLLREIDRMRKHPSPGLSGCDAMQIVIASMLMDKSEFNRRLKSYIRDWAGSNEHEHKARIFVSGSTLDHLGLYELIESAPAVVVGEDTAIGDRYAQVCVDPDDEPMEAIADRYTYKPLDPWMLGARERISYRVEAAVAASCDGVVFFHLRRDDPVAWDWPDQKAALEERGIPVLLLQDQDYSVDRHAAERIHSFVRQLRGRNG